MPSKSKKNTALATLSFIVLKYNNEGTFIVYNTCQVSCRVISLEPLFIKVLSFVFVKHIN